ncbi:cardiolipin synthase [Gilvimarinus polysaccharolyticus]|uniref:cardiolipin synthase n=1 Tax=Gilvimarinus polysaccharolyticus TaxID=863921 RepID=UPI000673501E|nr:cardiolipin synthase [Gilvimarinus polysaccharolyticus]
MEFTLSFVWSLLQQLLIWGHLLLVVVFAVRVIMRRLPVGVSLAWLLVLVLLPYVGVGLYLLFGERFLGVKRAGRTVRLKQAYLHTRRNGLDNQRQNWHNHHPASRALARLEYHTSGIPPLGGNRVDFLQCAPNIIAALVADIKHAKQFCHLEFYIWQSGGLVDRVVEALLAAAARGVQCRIMLDAVGSSGFFSSSDINRLQVPNIAITKACPIRFMPWQLARYDLRNHRKTVIIDNRVAYMGSFNLVDPAHFKVTAGVGQWIDMMARIEGPTVPMFDGVFRWYWNVETGEELPLLDRDIECHDSPALLQVAPSGPDAAKESILSALLQAIYAAVDSVDIVTPYFVPGEALEQALKIAARRGVTVRLIVPAKVDSFLVRHASHSYFSGLLESGVEVYTYSAGLLHTKAVVIDSALAFFGTVNLDLRSLWLNFEMTMIIYDRATAAELGGLLDGYRADADALSLNTWRKRSGVARFFENITHLFSPLI